MIKCFIDWSASFTANKAMTSKRAGEKKNIKGKEEAKLKDAKVD